MTAQQKTPNAGGALQVLRKGTGWPAGSRNYAGPDSRNRSIRRTRLNNERGVWFLVYGERNVKLIKKLAKRTVMIGTDGIRFSERLYWPVTVPITTTRTIGYRRV